MLKKLLVLSLLYIGIGNIGTYKYVLYKKEEFKLGYIVSASLLGPILPIALFIADFGQKCIANCKNSN